MPIILATEKRAFWTRLLIAGMYVALTLGGLSMVYPFILMVSGATKSSVDAYDFDLVPRYWYDNDMLYRKYVEEKHNEHFGTYAEHCGTGAFNFKDVVPPPDFMPALIADWSEFAATTTPPHFYLLGASMARNNQNVPANLRAFRAQVSDLCVGDIGALRRTFGMDAPNWVSVLIPYEALLDRNYQRAATPFMDFFYRFKSDSSPHDRIYVSCDRRYAQYVELDRKYDRNIDSYNRLNGTTLGSFAELCLGPGRPDAPGPAEDWEGFVRESLNLQFVRVDESARPGFALFLERKYGTVDKLNKLYGVTGTGGYDSLDHVPFPADLAHPSPALTDYANFLKDRELLTGAALSVDTPEIRWRAFLEKKYVAAAEAGRNHGRECAGFSTVRLPQNEANYVYCMENAGALRRHFLFRNFDMVFEYILLYGRGIRNTVVYCLLSILAALLVNPIAAYSLSRYNLRGQYKILLYLVATMAFPAVVTMIPNFLLLKELGLLNTFAALILPGMANGYAIFLLKGFFDSLPRELYEAADIDGATEWHKFWIVTMALSKPILAVMALNAFIAAYSNFMMAFIVCQDESMWTLMVWLFRLQGFASQGVIFASLIVAAVPTLVMFLFCQNLIIRGIVVPTEK